MAIKLHLWAPTLNPIIFMCRKILIFLIFPTIKSCVNHLAPGLHGASRRLPWLLSHVSSRVRVVPIRSGGSASGAFGHIS